jgi:hypothetical protein
MSSRFPRHSARQLSLSGQVLLGALAMRVLVTSVTLLCSVACIPPQAPAQQVSDVARDLNVAARFGRMDVALEHTSEEHQPKFMATRSDWGKEVRVLDVELARLELKSTEAAVLLVDVAWMRMNEGIMHSTRLEQRWENPGGGWKLSSEERASGDVGLLGENVVVLKPERPRDVHFPAKTIR